MWVFGQVSPDTLPSVMDEGAGARRDPVSFRGGPSVASSLQAPPTSLYEAKGNLVFPDHRSHLLCRPQNWFLF